MAQQFDLIVIGTGTAARVAAMRRRAAGQTVAVIASHDAMVVAGNLLEGNRYKPDYRGVPSVAFTIPPIVAVGLSEVDARKQGFKFRMRVQKAPEWFTARQAAEPVYGFKVLVEEETDRLLGAHLVGPHVDEIINLDTAGD